MVKAIDIGKELAGLPVLRNRSPETPRDEAARSFAALAAFGDGALFAGSFDGASDWERHRTGDEIVQILKGETTLTILTETGPQVLQMKAGMLAVVPQGCWHRFNARKGVTVLTATPQPTDHSTAEDPRDG